jgi:hypothetical protein
MWWREFIKRCLLTLKKLRFVDFITSFVRTLSDIKFKKLLFFYYVFELSGIQQCYVWFEDWDG